MQFFSQACITREINFKVFQKLWKHIFQQQALFSAIYLLQLPFFECYFWCCFVWRITANVLEEPQRGGGQGKKSLPSLRNKNMLYYSPMRKEDFSSIGKKKGVLKFLAATNITFIICYPNHIIKTLKIQWGKIVFFSSKEIIVYFTMSTERSDFLSSKRCDFYCKSERLRRSRLCFTPEDWYTRSLHDILQVQEL